MQLGGVAANQYVQTNDSRLSDARTPTAGSINYIQNLGQTPNASFAISGDAIINGKAHVGGAMDANQVESATGYTIGSRAVLNYNIQTFTTAVGTGSTPGGNSNTMVGVHAGFVNTTGFSNTFVGALAGSTNSTGRSNSFFGSTAGGSNTTGRSNSFFGDSAGQTNSVGESNSFFGANAGLVNDTGASNSFFGSNAGLANNADANSFFGANAGWSNTTGINNSFFGQATGTTNTTGQDNTFLGFNAGPQNVSGSGNTVVGSQAGLNNTTGGSNTFIGWLAGTPNGIANLTKSAAIGAFAQVSTSNTIVLGTNTETTSLPGNLAVSGISVFTTLGAAGATSLCRNNLNQLANCSSSLRYKTDLNPYARGLDVINRLHPISFTWKDGGMRDVGFGAEDVAKIEPLLVTYNAQGQVEGLKYDRITVALVNAIKEQQQQIAGLKQLVCIDHPGAAVCRK